MKKLFTLFLTLILCATMSAQFANISGQRLMKIAPQQQAKAFAPNARKAAAKKANLGPNQKIIGPYASDEYYPEGIGLRNYPGTYPVGTYIDASMLERFSGGKIVSVRFALTDDAEVSRVCIIPVTVKGTGEGYWQEISGAKVGWNEITLDTPYPLVTDGSVEYIIGYEYKQLSGQHYPIAIKDATTEGMLLMYGPFGESGETDWFVLGDYCLAIQGVVQMDVLEKDHVILSDFQILNKYAQSGGDMACALSLMNFGSEAPADYTLDFSVDGAMVGTIASPVKLTDDKQTCQGTVKLPAGLSTGEHTVSVSVATINGEPAKRPYTQSATVSVYQQSVPRQKYLVEQMTSNTCTYCPLAENVLKVVEKNMNIAWVAIHGNQSAADPSFITDNNSLFALLGANGFPLGAFNRLHFDGAVAQVLGYDASYAEMAGEYYAAAAKAYSAPAFISLNIAPTYDDATRALTVEVKGEAVEDFKSIYGEDAVINVWLTEDGLIYRQLNQGRWINSYEHNHVLRQYVTPYTGTALNWSGSSFQNTFVTTLDPAWNPETMKVVAFVTRKIDVMNPDLTALDVNNAEIVSLIGTSAISAVNADSDASSAALHNLAGQRVSDNFRGIYIYKGKKIVK